MTNKVHQRGFVNPKDEERAVAIDKILGVNNVKISRLVKKAMTEPLTEFEKQTKKNLHQINDILVDELKAMPRTGNIQVIG